MSSSWPHVSSRETSSDILAKRHLFEMLWIHTEAYTTEMIDGHPIFDWTHKHLIG